MQKTVKAFPKNKFQEIRVSITEYQGNDLIDIRTWTLPQGASEYSPTGKGVSINVKLYPEIKEAILALESDLKEAKLI
ncbi:MAG: transcriptional regulator [Candidatus Omnitrophica bacterium CG12_big_fil_rev_8_21_14_0_65_43_15]|uniref:Transcriptional regulator n=1 Tax=Candidatus Taenaricola geysiri TaxID=1974752 RepID=A0A2J0LHY6_9BACT|nr:MAG: hypothetical protein AUJ89_00715 [Candidatus Omnitrophica bacterium CG1_02_43_210]PIR66007.1 MAG: transcriptional regulator [Candidatus Omnitrophica bacterium CG10_big_fil_rev_8_21_14_0_10_43_8]PIV12252.1 MAG: transcriptional regulator [Candidatus Omnitrophica bacterium CG03_land_8_20_14_0_80_43_22]PIW66799.1 MAG: transcriptional regulator [Candidatus Omnitrophica bacterium CG12_big_fil_rev_8_21_14_0_65_43_15]PIW80739.1 MAG: transcriptional regulator [Candidatus Omnitrophica bacterium C